jgi:hypothetical protein
MTCTVLARTRKSAPYWRNQAEGLDMKFEREAFEFIDRLNRLSSIDAVMAATERMFGRFGFAHFAFSGVPYNSSSLPGIVLAHRIALNAAEAVAKPRASAPQ